MSWRRHRLRRPGWECLRGGPYLGWLLRPPEAVPLRQEGTDAGFHLQSAYLGRSCRTRHPNLGFALFCRCLIYLLHVVPIKAGGRTSVRSGMWFAAASDQRVNSRALGNDVSQQVAFPRVRQPGSFRRNLVKEAVDGIKEVWDLLKSDGRPRFRIFLSRPYADGFLHCSSSSRARQTSAALRYAFIRSLIASQSIPLNTPRA